MCHNVCIKPTLQNLTCKQFEQRRANTLDKTRLDAAARGFRVASQTVTFFDIRVFYSNSTRYVNQSLEQCYASNENERKRKYNKRVQNEEQRRFTPVVWVVSARSCTQYYLR